MSKKDIPFIAIGNEELENQPKISKFAICPKCKKKHKVKYGIDAKTKKKSKMLGFVNCGKESYLVAVNGKKLK